MKKTMFNTVLVLSLLVGGLSLSTTIAQAHGYVSSPGSRAYFGSSHGDKLNKNVGRAEWEPQSIETHKNTFIPGKLASAGVTGFEPLDEQTADRWYKSTIATDHLPITWTLTAQHRTATWQYYITKPNWDPNQPLDIKHFDLIATVDDHATIPEASVHHTINIPTDRKGYHVIYAVWNVYDTTNAFYQAIDVIIK